MDLPGVNALNGLSDEAFAHAVAPLFEGASRFMGRLAGARPFESDAALLAAARETAAGSPEDELVELLDAHPRIGADAAEMSGLSRGEQEDGVPADDALAQELADLNEAYEQRFGFRYVVFVAGRPRAAIAPLMEVALRNERDAELRRGVDDAIYIAGDRLRTLRGETDDTEEVGA
ncbi:MAG: 2-oxo-4-hydroxy-4-carboxy-5-ureidoimidazoline decarboxylase [Chloroflexota bacterium]|nr:2-oxo-4-hydroxy-4-carboxy-5-ureidoimidazoline decarboxylase [Chloroflexota bacterium]